MKIRSEVPGMADVLLVEQEVVDAAGRLSVPPFGGEFIPGGRHGERGGEAGFLPFQAQVGLQLVLLHAVAGGVAQAVGQDGAVGQVRMVRAAVVFAVAEFVAQFHEVFLAETELIIGLCPPRQHLIGVGLLLAHVQQAVAQGGKGRVRAAHGPALVLHVKEVGADARFIVVGHVAEERALPTHGLVVCQRPLLGGVEVERVGLFPGGGYGRRPVGHGRAGVVELQVVAQHPFFAEPQVGAQGRVEVAGAVVVF